MPRRTIIGLLNDLDTAEEALRELDAAGLDAADASLVTNEAVAQEHLGGDPRRLTVESTAAGAAGGAAVGALAGILAGASMVFLPVGGPLIAAGAVSAALATVGAATGIGAAQGAFLGWLVGLGMSEEDAHRYVESVNRGAILLVVEVPPDCSEAAAEALRRAGVRALDERPGPWQVPPARALPPEDADEEADPALVEVLGELAILCESGQQALRIAARNLRDPDLVKLLDSYAARHGSFASALRQEIERLDGLPRPRPELGEALREGWLNIKAAMTIEEELTAREVLAVGREAVGDVLQAYRQVLLLPMPASVRSLLEYQYARSKAMRAELVERQDLASAAGVEED